MYASLVQSPDLSSVHTVGGQKLDGIRSYGKRLHFIPLLQNTHIPDQNVSTHAQAFPPTHLAYLNYIVSSQRLCMAMKL